MNETLEALAVVLGLTYLLLAIKEKRSCWIAGAMASAIFMGIFWQAGLPMQGLLQVFYIAMAALGWWRWGRDSSTTPVHRAPWGYHGMMLACLCLLTLVTLLLRQTLTDLQAIVDTASSWAGVLATWMVAQKKLEAWIYWIVIDALTAGLYLNAGLLASSALYTVYTALAFIGWKQWRQSLRLQQRS
ncbi:nicotinamide riboside transporter PnuC [Congregibacter litoralis]|uniref:Nicotinamide riboside transporter PnuC n=1 Tax=Congregibacter litoralis KT71 TaxID=314285 RepID=A4A5J0_9GAMM|nr:nicotinamide riboside transporter PnuC [Congregibacter litoralis]EAQ99061.1 nicotinamide mononucleotide transporter PnuC [Congregibacter litoralis KT71]